MTILVTGAAGFIGSHLTESLLNDCEKVIALDSFSSYYSPLIKRNNLSHLVNNARFQLIKGDIQNKRLIEKIFRKNHVEKVVHLAAAPGARYSITEPALCHSVNVTGTLNLLEACRKNHIKHFLLASSSSVYGNPKHFPTKETENTDLQLNPYGTSKKNAELLCQAYNTSYHFPSTCLRFFTVYGPRSRPDLAMYKFTDAIFNDAPIHMFGDGNTQRDYTFVMDIISGIRKTLLFDADFEIINLGSGAPIKLKKIVELLEGSLQKDAIIQVHPKSVFEAQKTFADISKARRLLHWKPVTKIRDGITSLVDWYLQSHVK